MSSNLDELERGVVEVLPAGGLADKLEKKATPCG